LKDKLKVQKAKSLRELSMPKIIVPKKISEEEEEFISLFD
jgi:hypothetical protein